MNGPTTAEILEAVRAAPSRRAAARALGINESTLRGRLRGIDPTILEGVDELGPELEIDTVWFKSKKLSVRARTQPVDPVSFFKQALKEASALSWPVYPRRPPPTGERLLVLNLADLHIGKLCVEDESGYTFNVEIAVHRLVEGTRRLLEMARPHGVSRCLVVTGSDGLQVDNRAGTTTKGTGVDQDGTIYQAYPAALKGLELVFAMVTEDMLLDHVHIPGNHDKTMGWALSGALGVAHRNNPRYSGTDYNLSPRPRKYYVYEQNLIGLSHASGEKDKDLYALMMTEAQKYVSLCDHRYFYRQHLHHKIAKSDGLTPQQREKDHAGLTVMHSSSSKSEGDLLIEYLRSPSPPDAWHAEFGYVNRQAVEVFVHDPGEGQVARFTAWF